MGKFPKMDETRPWLCPLIFRSSTSPGSLDHLIRDYYELESDIAALGIIRNYNQPHASCQSTLQVLGNM
jgi:hypothetical protein